MKKFKHIKNKYDFIDRANTVHNFKYEYSKVEFPKRDLLYSYNGEKTRRPPEYYREAKIIITCPKHGDFIQTARKHIEKNGSGCQSCARERTSKASYGRDKKADYKTANIYEVKNDMIVLKATPSDGAERKILIDKQDEEILSTALWYVTGHQKSRRSRTNYCVTRRNDRIVDEGYEWLGSHPKMHRLIMSRILNRPLHKGELVDHINQDGLDNRRQNLRITNHSQNKANVPKHSGIFSSKYKGVSYSKSKKKWISYIGSAKSNGIKREYLGSYPPTPEGELQAAMAYDRRAIEVWGEFACTNFPIEDYK